MSKHNHIVAEYWDLDDNLVIIRAIRANRYKDMYSQIYSGEKLEICPECREKINWYELEAQIGG